MMCACSSIFDNTVQLLRLTALLPGPTSMRFWRRLCSSMKRTPQLNTAHMMSQRRMQRCFACNHPNTHTHMLSNTRCHTHTHTQKQPAPHFIFGNTQHISNSYHLSYVCQPPVEPASTTEYQQSSSHPSPAGCMWQGLLQRHIICQRQGQPASPASKAAKDRPGWCP